MYTEQELITKLTPIFKQYPIKRAALFGSYARGEQRAESDIDLILDYEFSNELPDFLDFWDELERVAGLRADVLTFNSLDTTPRIIRANILKEMRYIYET